MGRRRASEGESSCSSSSETGQDQSSLFVSHMDLRLGLTISSSHHTSSSSRQNHKETWEEHTPSLFVKVNMEGIPFGRKLDLFTHQTYHSLLSTLSHMFKVPIFCPGVTNNRSSQKHHILTYQDQDGDWMLVGDVPWEMFLTSVKKLKITKPDDHATH